MVERRRNFYRLLAELADAPDSKPGSNKVESRFDPGAGDQVFKDYL